MPEDDFLFHLRRTRSGAVNVPIDIGDDLAGLNWAGGLLLCGCDQVLDGVHFDSATHSPEQIGTKAANRNLSDVAAMAGEPVAMLCSVAVPKHAGTDYAKRLVDGVRQAGAAFNCPLVGGDTGSWPGGLAVVVSILARIPPGRRAITRSGARPGDRVYVTGRLGGSILGRHLEFIPRVALARELAGRFEISAMMDLSDGLSSDLPRLCQLSNVGATIDAKLLPVHEDARRMSDDLPAVEHALHDGEDYELLFTSPVCEHPMVTEVGTIDTQHGVRLKSNGVVVPLARSGWEHQL
jgi:thiamine-monophosphate kinase